MYYTHENVKEATLLFSYLAFTACWVFYAKYTMYNNISLEFISIERGEK